MRPTAVHVLIGLLVALLPWLPSCPARIAAADLPPSPPKGGNFSAESRFQETSVAAQSGGGASSNAVLVAEEKADARSVIPLSESSAVVTNCTGDHCRRTASEEPPVNSGNNSSSVVLRGPVVVEEDGAVAPRGEDGGPEEGPLPIANQGGAEDESSSPPGNNGIEEASRTTSTVHPNSFDRNGTASTNSVTNSTNYGIQLTSNTNKILTATPTGAESILGRPSGVEGNDVFPSTQGVQLGSELPKISDTKMAAEGEVSETVPVGKVTSTPDPSSRVTVASMSESGMNSKVHKTTKHKMNVVSKVEDDGDDEGHREDMDDDMEGTEDEDEGSWDGHLGTDGERTMTHGSLHSEYTTGRDGVNLHYKKFTKIEAHDSEEPGTTRSYVVVEKGTKVDYSSSSVVSEVYDSEMPAEEESTGEPSSLQETSESRQNNSVSALTRLDATESHLHDDDHEDSVDDLDDDVDETEREQNHTTMTSDMEGGRDQEKASGDSYAFTTTIKMEDIKPTVPVPSSTSTKGVTETSGPDQVSESIRNSMENPTGTSYPTDSTSSVESSTSTPLVSEISSSTQPVTDKTLPSSTAAYSPRTSRRLNLVRTSTTESSIKNEVTYHENTTGPIYDFKANISLTTPVVYLMSSTSPTPSSITQTNGSVLMSQASTPAQPPVSTPVTSATVSTETASQSTTSTEIPDTQVGGNSINDWRIIGDVVDNNSSEETSSLTTIPPSGSDEFEMTTVSTSVLFTTVKKSDVTDLTIENMSMNTTYEQEIMVTESSSAAILTHGNRTDVSGGKMDNASQKTSTETMSTLASSTVTPESISSGGSTTSSSINRTSTESILTGDTSSSTSGDLHVYEVDTKVPPVTLVHASDTSASDSSNKDGGTNYTVTVQPIFTTARSNTTVTPEHSTPAPEISRKIAEGSPEMKISPETTVRPKHPKVEGINSTTKAPDSGSGLEFENEVSFIADPAYVRLWMKISWNEICSKQLQQSLKQALAQLISSSAHSHVPIDRVMLLNFAKSCLDVNQEERHPESLSAVHFCILSGIMGSSGKGHENSRGTEGEERPTTVVHCDAALMQLFLNAWNQTPKPMVEPLIHVQEVDIVNSSFGAGNGMELPGYPPDNDKTGIQAAIGISCIAAVCLLFLATLLIIMRRRQRRFNYGQRCTPVSLDDYSLDSVSVREGNRGGRGQARNGDLGRGANGLSKGDGLNDWRASKRSYGNPAFEDDDGEEVLLSKPMNFAMLSNAAMDEDGALEDEFRLIPKKFRKRTVRRKSRARYKDPAATVERGEAGTSNRDGDDDDETIPEGAEEKNRYANVVPLPSTRVRLMAKSSGPLSTYINANYVRGYQNKEHFYIACQAPLQSTIEDFWRMIWEQQSKVILMLTNLVENSVEKCADYLPPSEVLDCHRLFGDYQVTLKKREVREKYIVSSLQLKDMESNLWREVTHLWFLGWPDQGVPDEPNQIIAFLIEARPFMKTNSGPTVVHCSPGTGRTGTVIAIDISIREFEQSRMVDVPKVVQQLRRDRDGAVQTHQQYTFIYKALSLYATKLTGGAMDSF